MIIHSTLSLINKTPPQLNETILERQTLNELIRYQNKGFVE